MEARFDLEAYNDFETEYVKILYYDLPKNYTGWYETKSYSRFCTILEGEKYIEARSKQFFYDTNQSMLLPSHTKVEMSIEKPTKALVFELNDQLVRKVIDGCKVEINPEERIDVQEVLVNNFQRNIKEDVQSLVSLSYKDDRKEAFMIDLYAQKLIYDLLGNKMTSKVIMEQCRNPFNHILRYITDNIEVIAGPKEVADQFGMSVSNFSHSFKKYTGLQPQKFILNEKMERAKGLLTKETVTEVAFRLGYDNLSYFIKKFKGIYGVTPKQYQIQNGYYF